MSEHNIIEDATKWRKLIGWIKKTAYEEDTDIWEFLEDELGVDPTGIEHPTSAPDQVIFWNEKFGCYVEVVD